VQRIAAAAAPQHAGGKSLTRLAALVWQFGHVARVTRFPKAFSYCIASRP
jgi:hypothetical protein